MENLIGNAEHSSHKSHRGCRRITYSKRYEFFPQLLKARCEGQFSSLLVLTFQNFPFLYIATKAWANTAQVPFSTFLWAMLVPIRGEVSYKECLSDGVGMCACVNCYWASQCVLKHTYSGQARTHIPRMPFIHCLHLRLVLTCASSLKSVNEQWKKWARKRTCELLIKVL